METLRPLHVLLLLLGGTSHAQADQLRGDLNSGGIAGFERLVERAHSGALAPGITGASFSLISPGHPRGSAVRVELARTGGDHFGVLLLRPSLPRASPSRYFVLLPEEGVPARDLEWLSTRLDELFPTDPWSIDPPREPRGPPPVGLGRVSVALVFLALSIAAGLLFLLRSRPRISGESAASDDS